MLYTDLELLEIQANVLYVHDDHKKLLRINECDADDPAPRFFLGRSLAGNIWRLRHDLPADLATALEALAAAEPIVTDLRQPPFHLANYVELLEAHAPISETYSGPAYYLPQLAPPEGTVSITPENSYLLATNFPYTLTILDERSPVVVVAVDGAAVTACYTARSTPYAAEAGVDTQEAHRGKGYALHTVRGWAQAVRASGKLPLYSTWWANGASLAVAAKLGAVLYGTDFNIT